MKIAVIKIHLAYENWFFARTSFSYEGYAQYSDPIMTTEFRIFLGMPDDTIQSSYKAGSDTVDLTPEAAAKIDMLLSPHHETIIKAYYIRKTMDPKITTEDAKVAEIITALYPILYPIEQQDCKIQELHRSIVTNLAIALWRAFAGTPHP